MKTSTQYEALAVEQQESGMRALVRSGAEGAAQAQAHARLSLGYVKLARLAREREREAGR